MMAHGDGGTKLTGKTCGTGFLQVRVCACIQREK